MEFLRLILIIQLLPWPWHPGTHSWFFKRFLVCFLCLNDLLHTIQTMWLLCEIWGSGIHCSALSLFIFLPYFLVYKIWFKKKLFGPHIFLKIKWAKTCLILNKIVQCVILIINVFSFCCWRNDISSPIVFWPNTVQRKWRHRSGAVVSDSGLFLARATISTVPAAWWNFLFSVPLLFLCGLKTMSKLNSSQHANSENAFSWFSEPLIEHPPRIQVIDQGNCNLFISPISFLLWMDSL